MRPYRILVVDDSAFMRKIISDLIEQDPQLKVEGTAQNGQEAIKRIAELQPDLVTMDVEMPEMNGLEALRQIMADKPLPVIMLSGINEEGMRETIMALELGAFDFIRKPSMTTSSQGVDEVGKALREQIVTAMQAQERREARIAADLAILAKPLTTQEPLKSPPTSSGKSVSRNETVKERPLKDSPEQVANPLLGKSQTKAQPGTRSGGLANLGKRGQNREQTGLSGTPANNPAQNHATNLKPMPSKEAHERISAISRPPAAGDVANVRGNTNSHDGKKAEREAVGRQEHRSTIHQSSSGYTDIVAIGCSTGGPKALKTLLEMIPADFPAPIVIVQHMPPNFTHSLAQRLNSLSPLHVVEAEEGMELQKGWAYIAPGGFHITVKPSSGDGYRIALNKDDLRNGHRPSADVLYESLQPLESLKRHIVLMTGMGSDGARVMKQLYDAGVTSTFAESEETCVVYGMPRSAVELKCVSHVLPLYDIAPKLIQVVK
ncbi:chemotaxis response regulator protein-glutamate methylesterase [Paenibacillus zeisoli]|uniref:Protein-glutamate methylesterase/protein-glutamine glutaminase n=1 Tax=Paenibacillus zeisoli TaxID=2496267 RepID=A0A433X6R0_9BACL|nr:chemotaxis response regulator protein-glutamate methylesterase [Paenibacillus zeisoli]RUT29730.1 chemotaxis response regulator protein-glutamate methylesterase [Paenibacillus zeisoli]